MRTHHDPRGLPITGLNPSQIERYERLLHELYAYRPGVQAGLDDLLREAPSFVLGHVLRGYAVMADGLRSGLPEAQRLAATASEREGPHIYALKCEYKATVQPDCRRLKIFLPVGRWMCWFTASSLQCYFGMGTNVASSLLPCKPCRTGSLLLLVMP